MTATTRNVPTPTPQDAAGDAPATPQLQTVCPHCGGVLDLTTWAPPTPTQTLPALPPPTTAAHLWELPAWLERWLRRAMPITRGTTAAGALPRWRRRLRWLYLVPLLAVLIWWGIGRTSLAPTTQTPAPAAAPVVPPVPTVTSVVTPLDADVQAVLAVVMAYNAADPVVASTQSLDPLVPYLDPDGALYAEREAALIARQAAGDAYAVRLVGMGSTPQVEIDPSGTTATVITQETWEGTADGQPPQTVTVRVAYTLERTDADDGWWIVAAERVTL